MRRASRVDANHKDIMAAFRSLGWSVLDLSAVGKGCPDIAVATSALNVLVEIKDGSKPPSARKLNDKQVEFHEKWRGPIIVIESVEQVFEFVKKVALRSQQPRGDGAGIIGLGNSHEDCRDHQLSNS